MLTPGPTTTDEYLTATGSYPHPIILAVVHNGKWGALGISRRNSLMYKDLTYDSLSDIILDFKTSYESCCHQLLKVYIGLPFGHDTHANDPIKWRALKLSIENLPWAESRQTLDRFAREGPSLAEHLLRCGCLPEEFNKRASNVIKTGVCDEYSDAEDGSDGDNPIERAEKSEEKSANARSPRRVATHKCGSSKKAKAKTKRRAFGV